MEEISRLNLWQQDKGHVDEVRSFSGHWSAAVANFHRELAEVTQASFDAVRAAESREVIRLSPISYPLVTEKIEPVTRTA